MDKLRFLPVTDQVKVIQFDCGISSINDYVKNSYFPYIAQQAYAYSIVGNGQTLGFYQILFREIRPDIFPNDFEYFGSEIKDEISAVHIRFIAIDKKYQHKKIGSCTLRSIIRNVEDLSNTWPIRVITIDALNSLVDWYKNMGFKELKKNTCGQEGTTSAMYFDCTKFYNEVNNFHDSMV